MREFLLKNQQKIAIIIGYTIVFLLALGLGRVTVYMPSPPEIKIEEPQVAPQTNDTAEVKGAQSLAQPANSAISSDKISEPNYQGGFVPVNGSCNGKIKGSSGKIYHVLGGAFYERTAKPVVCFNTEAQAQAAGFRKSLR